MPINVKQEKRRIEAEKKQQQWVQSRIQQSDNMIPEMKKLIVDFLSRNSFWSGYNLGKAFGKEEIYKGLGLKPYKNIRSYSDDDLRRIAFDKAMQYFVHKSNNPEGIKLLKISGLEASFYKE